MSKGTHGLLACIIKSHCSLPIEKKNAYCLFGVLLGVSSFESKFE